MGFGLLLIGYFLMLNIPYHNLTDIFSALIMMLALYRLAPINKGFRYAYFLLFPITVVSAVGFFAELFRFVGLWTDKAGYIIKIIAVPQYLLFYAFTILMLSGIRDVSEETGLRKYVASAIKCMIYSSLFYIPWTILTAGLLDHFSQVTLTAMFVMIIGYISDFCILFLLHGCYRKICMPDDDRTSAAPPLKSAEKHKTEPDDGSKNK